MKQTNKKYIVSLILLLIILLFGSSLAFAENRDGITGVNSGNRVATVNSLDDIVNNQIESGNFKVLNYQGRGNLLILDYQYKNYQNRECH